MTGNGEMMHVFYTHNYTVFLTTKFLELLTAEMTITVQQILHANHTFPHKISTENNRVETATILIAPLMHISQNNIYVKTKKLRLSLVYVKTKNCTSFTR